MSGYLLYLYNLNSLSILIKSMIKSIHTHNVLTKEHMVKLVCGRWLKFLVNSWYIKLSMDFGDMISSTMDTVSYSGHVSWHACPLPCTPPCHTCPPLPHTPPFAMHTPPLQCMPLHHACPLCYTCPTHLCGQKELYMLVKTLSFRNYCCGR